MRWPSLSKCKAQEALAAFGQTLVVEEHRGDGAVGLAIAVVVKIIGRV